MTKEKQRRKDCQWLTVHYTEIIRLSNTNLTKNGVNGDGLEE